ncbi:hypothetical protein Rt10032_c06g2847 [Rhodotorula toruloides]|uniref:RNase III domain-containing protein n=1 Tax=Rhodotorula toruloides TaxID=5286 RepID=A0A511KEM8_RHOTO|nr:hypothetical protein Rt10032_c06g2847 [Rhodotorula toruloides]
MTALELVLPIDSCVFTLIHPLTRRDPPPSAWNWDPPQIELCAARLPPLPAVRDPDLAFQARASKPHFVALVGHNEDHFADEVRSYRRLEWLGDGCLHGVMTAELFDRFPGSNSGTLTRLRGIMVDNNLWSLVSRAYSLDDNVITGPPPLHYNPDWKPLIQSQKVVADLFEAPMGALVPEKREAEVVGWVRAFLDGHSDVLANKYRVFLEQTLAMYEKGGTRKRTRVTAASKTGNREFTSSPPQTRAGHASNVRASCAGAGKTNNRLGVSISALRATLRLSRLPCPDYYTAATTSLYRYEAQGKLDALWHVHLILDDTVVGCGVAKKKQDACEAAMTRFLSNALERGAVSIGR